MGTELGIKLRGAPAELDARRVIAQLQGVLRLLGLLEDSLLKTDRGECDRSSWGFSRLQLGSIEATWGGLLDDGAVGAELLV